jgi:hypothetical protein
MLRTFSYTFDPFAGGPIKGNSAEIAVDEIENAGLLEVLQAPGASLGSWAFLNELLVQTGSGTPFVFKEPLGQAREVKVALSCLFGRFVARAYLERYFNLSIFAHLGRRSFRLDRRMRITIKRKKGQRGDFPDWLASDASLKKLLVAEAKGCHDKSGPDQALARAWAQANRINVIRRRRGVQTKAQVKRIAIAMRWGVASGGPADPIIAVRDPDESGDMTPDEMNAALVGVARYHTANLLTGIGFGRLAHAVVELINASSGRAIRDTRQTALGVLADTETQAPTEVQPLGPSDSLLGRWVTRSGYASEARLSASDQAVLDRLNLRPVFVGIERQFVQAVIGGELNLIRGHVRERVTTGTARTNGTGVWMLRPQFTGSESQA